MVVYCPCSRWMKDATAYRLNILQRDGTIGIVGQAQFSRPSSCKRRRGQCCQNSETRYTEPCVPSPGNAQLLPFSLFHIGRLGHRFHHSNQRFPLSRADNRPGTTATGPLTRAPALSKSHSRQPPPATTVTQLSKPNSTSARTCPAACNRQQRGLQYARPDGETPRCHAGPGPCNETVGSSRTGLHRHPRNGENCGRNSVIPRSRTNFRKTGDTQHGWSKAASRLSSNVRKPGFQHLKNTRFRIALCHDGAYKIDHSPGGSHQSENRCEISQTVHPTPPAKCGTVSRRAFPNQLAQRKRLDLPKRLFQTRLALAPLRADFPNRIV